MRSAPIRDSATLGRLLVELRAEAGMTQRELAEELGVTQRYIVELEQGKHTKSMDRMLKFISRTGGRLYLETNTNA